MTWPLSGMCEVTRAINMWLWTLKMEDARRVHAALGHQEMEAGVKSEKTVLPLETGLILSQEPVEMMEEYPVEDGPLRMSGTIESRHSRRKASRNGPTSQIGPRLPGKT